MTPDDRAMRILARYSSVPTESGCILWTGALDKDGYGKSSTRHHSRRAHRLAYMLLVGPIPEGLVIDHLCRVRACVNPAHMEPVTVLENSLRGDVYNLLPELPGCSKHGKTDGYVAQKSGYATRRWICKECARVRALARYHRTKKLKSA